MHPAWSIGINFPALRGNESSNLTPSTRESPFRRGSTGSPRYRPDCNKNHAAARANRSKCERLLGGNWKIRPAAGLHFGVVCRSRQGSGRISMSCAIGISPRPKRPSSTTALFHWRCSRCRRLKLPRRQFNLRQVRGSERSSTRANDHAAWRCGSGRDGRRRR
jgi:hypothetical protein